MKYFIPIVIATFILVFTMGGSANAYIGPGLGVVAVWALLGPIAAVIISVLILAYFPLRYYYKKYKYNKAKQDGQEEKPLSDD